MGKINERIDALLLKIIINFLNQLNFVLKTRCEIIFNFTLFFICKIKTILKLFFLCKVIIIISPKV